MAAKQDFFISYNQADAEIAAWIAAQLKEAGYTVVIESEDFAAGGNFVQEMHRRLDECERVIAVLSPDYLTARYVHAEWGAAFRRDPTGELRLLVPVRVRPCQPGGLLAAIVYIDLAGLPEADAAPRLRTEIAKSLRSARQAIAGAAPLPSGPAAPAGVAAYARHQLPPPPRVFVGRDDDVAALLDQLARGEAGGAAICGSLQGMGGVGKTALALVVAHRLAGGYPAAQLYRDLRGADEKQRTPLAPAEVMRDLILALRPDCGQLPEDEERLGPLYRAVLAEAGPVLLLLDNAADAAQVEPLLPPPGCLLLVTSRQHFHLPDCLVRDLDSLPAAEAEQLLTRLVRNPARLAGHAAEAARLCAGLPLALKVFAGALDDESITPVPDLLAALREGKRHLTPVDAAFAVSESLLPEEARTAWRLLSIFTASFDLPAAAAVWEKEPAAARAPMQALVNASLVEFNADSARFRLHDLARQYGDRAALRGGARGGPPAPCPALHRGGRGIPAALSARRGARGRRAAALRPRAHPSRGRLRLVADTGGCAVRGAARLARRRCGLRRRGAVSSPPAYRLARSPAPRRPPGRRPAGRGRRARQSRPRPRRLGRRVPGHRVLRAAPGHRTRDRRPARGGQRARQSRQRPLRLGGRAQGHRVPRAGRGDQA